MPLLRAFFHLVLPTLLAAAALLHAHAVSGLVESALARPAAAAPAAPVAPGLALACAPPPQPPVAPIASARFAPGPVLDHRPRMTTVCVGVHPTVTFAEGATAVLDVGGELLVRKQGEEVVAGMRLTHVAPEGIWLDRDGLLCEARLGGGGLPGVSPPPVISREVHVHRAMVDRMLEEQTSRLAATITPSFDHGRATGVIIHGIKRGSLLPALGFEVGDRVETINGFSIAEPDRALEAYARLRTADFLTVQLTRHGRTVLLRYSID